MLSPDMILEDVRFGEELETKGEYYKAYWVYMFAESAVEREDEAMCLIGSQRDFGDAELEACRHRRGVWRFLTKEEKLRARQGINPFTNLLELQNPPRAFIPYDLCGYHISYVQEDTEEEDGAKRKSMTRKEVRRLTLLFILALLLKPFFRNKWQ